VRYTGLESPLVTTGTSRRLSVVAGGAVPGGLLHPSNARRVSGPEQAW